MTRLLIAWITLLGIWGACTAQHPLPAPPATTRVAIVNIGYVFNHYSRTIGLKNILSTSPEYSRLRDESRALCAEVDRLEANLRERTVCKETKEKLEQQSATARARLESLTSTITAFLVKRQQEHLTALWKDIQIGVKAYAEKNAIHIVIGYGEVVHDDERMNQFPNINRKVQSMDLGGAYPLYASPGLDISEPLVKMLNRWVTERNPILPPAMAYP